MTVTAPDTFRQLQLDFYREAAHRYNSWAGGANVRAAERLALFADVQPHERVIDLGCGTGLISRSLGLGGSTLDHVAVDVSPDMIEYAREQAGAPGSVHYSVMDAHDLVFSDGIFDVACSASRSQASRIHGEHFPRFGVC